MAFLFLSTSAAGGSLNDSCKGTAFQSSLCCANLPVNKINITIPEIALVVDNTGISSFRVDSRHIRGGIQTMIHRLGRQQIGQWEAFSHLECPLVRSVRIIDLTCNHTREKGVANWWEWSILWPVEKSSILNCTLFVR